VCGVVVRPDSDVPSISEELQRTQEDQSLGYETLTLHSPLGLEREHISPQGSHLLEVTSFRV